MKKGIARLGIIAFVSLFTSPCFAMSVSDLLISEIMANPAAIADTRGEWFELYNPTMEPINLRGIDLGDDGSSRHRFDTDLLILPNQFLTLARSADAGFVPDYVYDNFTLANSGDEIVLRDGLLELLRLDYGPGFARAGVSRELQQLPMTASNYALTLASLSFGAGDIGTPGMAGGMLPAPSAVPLPATAWLFISGLMAVFSPTALRKVLGTPVNPAGSVTPIRRAACCVGPAQAARSAVSIRGVGISKWTRFTTQRPIWSPRKSAGLQS